MTQPQSSPLVHKRANANDDEPHDKMFWYTSTHSFGYPLQEDDFELHKHSFNFTLGESYDFGQYQQEKNCPQSLALSNEELLDNLFNTHVRTLESRTREFENMYAMPLFAQPYTPSRFNICMVAWWFYFFGSKWTRVNTSANTASYTIFEAPPTTTMQQKTSSMQNWRTSQPPRIMFNLLEKN